MESMAVRLFYGLPWAMFILSLGLFLLFLYVRLFRYHTTDSSDVNSRYKSKPRRVAFLIASKNGEKTIEKVIKAAKRNRRQVYVVSDGSTDKTAKIAKDSGAKVLNLRINIGKPSALHRAYKHFNLSKRFDAVAILDDDVLISRDFIVTAKNAMDGNTAISVGRNITNWPIANKWNIWLASRAYSYWNYQLMLRNVQSSYNVMNCISGSNSLYRTEVLDAVLNSKTPYIVDDTYWTLETHRLGLGNIKYASRAEALIQDPSNFKDWYKQNLRWMWGTYQGIVGHKIGSKINLFHMSYIALITQWVFYVLSAPVLAYIIILGGFDKLLLNLIIVSAGYSIWVVAAAISLKNKRLMLFTPAIIFCDLLFRVVMVHAIYKTFKQKTVKNCVWVSPTRFKDSVA